MSELKQIFIDNQITSYFITEDGKLFNEKTQTWHKGRVSENGYLDYILTINGKQKSCRAHRLVAQAFIPNPHNLPIVNHKDGNKLNNHITNLEWVAYQQNTNHAYQNNLIGKNAFTKDEQKHIEDEEWKPILDTHYQVSNYGRVKNLLKNNILKGKTDTGYRRFEIVLKDGTRKTFLGHRLVMHAFSNLDLNDKESIINHIDGDKLNNKLSNLEIVNRSENMLHSYHVTKTNSRVRYIYQYDLEGIFLKEWAGANQAARELNIKQGLITSACQRKGTSHGFRWRYKDEVEEENKKDAQRL